MPQHLYIEMMTKSSAQWPLNRLETIQHADVSISTDMLHAGDLLCQGEFEEIGDSVHAYFF